MTRDDLRRVVLEELAHLAPEADLATLPGSARLREDLDLDSFDFARLVTAIDERLGVNVPETDYRKLETLDGCLDYLAALQPAASPASVAHP
jgi:acyl carrier protein